MKKQSIAAARVVPQGARGPLFSLAAAWRAAEDLGGRPADPAPSTRSAGAPSAGPRPGAADTSRRA
jgi:hypothetical protein